ncbi:MAG: XRE family transcriptional regulator [Candidatus Moranbacteria bacterium]|nr:XRE family transcriptional regulator [Candidatus Moranbacteria bacterium]
MLYYLYTFHMAQDNKIGNKLRKARLKLGLTQSEVARGANMTVNYYAMIERGEVNPSLEKIESLTKVLKLKITIS